MSVTKIGKRQTMSTAAIVAEKLVIREEMRTRSRMLAYQRVASQVGRSSDWLRKLIRNGASRIDGEIERRLDALLIRSLEADIARNEAELALARQGGCHPASQHIAEIETHLARARALLNGSSND